MGAWIETRVRQQFTQEQQSHPSWVRGLKPFNTFVKYSYCKSHPSWVRGLKLIGILSHNKSIRSHPSWVRGLKPYLVGLKPEGGKVALLVGAWIETQVDYH